MDPLKIAKKTLSAVGELTKIVGENRLIRKAAREVAKSLLTLTTFLNVLLLPIAFLNWLFRKQVTSLWRRLLRARAAKRRARDALKHHAASESELSFIDATVLLAIYEAAPRRVTATDLALLVRIPWSSLYLALDALERNQWLMSESADPPLQIGGPRRRYYQLTDAGVYKARKSIALISCIPRLAQSQMSVGADDASIASGDGSTRG